MAAVGKHRSARPHSASSAADFRPLFQDMELGGCDGLIVCPEAGCDFRTGSLRKLGRHRSVTHSDTKYRCELCAFVTGYQSNFYRHRKQVHGTSGGASAHKASAQLNPPTQGDTAAMSTSSSTPQLPPELLALMQGAVGGEGGADVMAAFYLRMAAAAAAQLPGPNTALDPLTLLLLQAQAQQNNPQLQQPLSINLPANSTTLPADDKKYVCEECGCTMDKSKDYLHHLRDVHGEVFRIHYCDRCDYATRQATKMGRHQAQSHDARSEEPGPPSETESDKDSPGTLVVCDDAAAADGALAPPSSLQKLRCHLCPYETDDDGRYKKHLRCHKTTAETQCRLCDFNTVYSWNLDRHMRSHRCRARYTCLRCSFSQNTRQSITFHLQHHHKVTRVDVETQTDEVFDGPTAVDVETEPFVFEVHSVRFVPDDQLDSPANSVHSPSSESSITSNTSQFLQKSGFAERFMNRYGTKKEEMKTPDSVPAESRKRELSVKEESESPASGKKTLKLDDTAVRKYLSETDAIETPSEERDFKDLEKDPDVQTRVCSICGYQGKWISEMIRHKRVHTNERPFKCRYCNRTSKWKADLIRHVAKVHGIRVVSKYSRSKTFDSDAGMMRALKEQHGFVDADGSSTDQPTAESPALLRLLQDVAHILPNPSDTERLLFRCKWCSWEASEIQTMLDHSGEHSEDRSRSESREPEREAETSLQSACSYCPFTSESELALMAHRKAHQKPTGLFNFKCHFCKWYSKKKASVAEHMRLHTSEPEKFMSEVERNLITPATPASPLKPLRPTGCPLDFSLPKTEPDAEEAKPNTDVVLAFSDVSDLVSDFSAIIDAAGGDMSRQLQSLRDDNGNFAVSVADGKTEAVEEAVKEVEDEGYVHAGLGSPGDSSGEIRKVTLFQNGAVSRLWQCRYCPHASKRRANIRLHEKKHGSAMADGASSELLECGECDYRGDRRSLNAHVGVHTGAPMPARLPCPSCPAFFRSQADLARHRLGHGSGRTAACPKCDYALDDARLIQLHAAVHAAPDDTDEDDAATPTPKTPLSKPLTSGRGSSSTKPKKHMCPSCPARFADTTQLTRHVAFHGVDMAHKCPHCDYAVPFQINLIKHMKAHHGAPLDVNANAALPAFPAVPPLPSLGLQPDAPEPRSA